jgi:hypothetical protein
MWREEEISSVSVGVKTQERLTFLEKFQDRRNISRRTTSLCLFAFVINHRLTTLQLLEICRQLLALGWGAWQIYKRRVESDMVLSGIRA